MCSPAANFYLRIRFVSMIQVPEGGADSETTASKFGASESQSTPAGKRRADAEANGALQIIANSDCRRPSHYMRLVAGPPASKLHVHFSNKRSRCWWFIVCTRSVYSIEMHLPETYFVALAHFRLNRRQSQVISMSNVKLSLSDSLGFGTPRILTYQVRGVSATPTVRGYVTSGIRSH
jgi:hypothetical protein